MNKIAIIILARKNSKRIPGKNFKAFLGKPLIHYTLQTAYKLKLDTYLMTDYQEIKEYAQKYYKKINIIHMESRFSQDKHDLMGSLIYLHEKIKADVYILLQPTSPVRSLGRIRQWIKDFQTNKYDSGISAFPIENKYCYGKKGILNFKLTERTGNGCKKESIYTENGAFYIFKKERLTEKYIIGGRIMLCFDKYNIDLDTMEDWNKAELLIKNGFIK